MKKKIIFLMTICTLILSLVTNVHAEQSMFYEAEYIDNIYMNRQLSTQRGTIYYQKARLFRQAGTNKFAYCVEPTVFFDGSAIYDHSDIAMNLSNEQKERIQALAHFGYGYLNHDDIKWYAITQMEIWRTADPAGNYYFTDRLNGRRIDVFQGEVNELNSLIENYNKEANIPNIDVTLIEGETYEFHDENNELNNYKVNIGTIENNTYKFTADKTGKFVINFEKNDNYYNEPLIFYNSCISQNLVTTGNISKNTVREINVIKTGINIKKVDSETKKSEKRGQASIEGTIYTLYDKENNKVGNIEINEKGFGSLNKIKLGNYTLKETKAGVGYKLDKKTYEINITKDNNIINLTLEDDIISTKLKLHKLYGSKDNFIGEENVMFNIFDEENKLVETITTDKFGYAEITLNYGTYKVEQLTTTEGYEKVDSFTIEIKDDKELTFELKDYKIEVPNTNVKYNLFQKIIIFFEKLLCLNI